MSYATQSPTVKGGRRTGLLVLGLVLLLGGVGAAAALFVSSGSQYADGVKNLQRAPVGCDTEFNFTGTGTFIFYAESKGKVGDLRGDCANTGTTYDHGTARIRVDLTMTDSNGDPVDLARTTGASYDKDGYVGTEIRSLTISKPGKYTLSVQSDDSDFTIAVGRNPKKDADSAKTTALIVGGAGLVIGLVLILLGLRRKAAPAGPASFGQPGGFPPAGFPPVGGQPAGPPNWAPSPPPSSPPGFGEPYPPQPPQAPPQAPPPPPWGTPHP